MSRFRHAREAQARLLAWVEHFNNALNRSFHVELSSDLARLGYWLGEIRAYQRTLKEGRFDLEGLKSISWSVDYNLRQMFCTPVQIQRRSAPPDSAPPETPSEALFERLAAENPQRLLAMLVANELRPALLTYAAEIAGRTLPSEMCVPVLVPLLYHESALVREGTVYGLAEHLDELVTSELRKVSNNDSSAGVRAAATGTLEGR